MSTTHTHADDVLPPLVRRDIDDLERKIRLYREGIIDEEKFRSVRLMRGIYGQRQPGVQMVRIKIPFGRLTVRQLLTITDIAEEYGHGVLHATTRQDIQIHYVSLDRTPELWDRLEREDVTLRGACGNTVRNITASAAAGIDPKEPFDVSPYAYELFRYFLRNPVCQELGRKFKMAFSSSDEDTAFAFMHDIGFIPKVRDTGGSEQRGFKVVIGGGLGANPMLAHTAFEFLEEQLILPFAEAILRVFDRYGERKNRQKARMKFLLDQFGLEKLLGLVKEEWAALNVKEYYVDRECVTQADPAPLREVPASAETDAAAYATWLGTNVFGQKQAGMYGVYVRVPLGNLDVKRARLLAEAVRLYAADDIRVTIDQGYLLKFVRPEHLGGLYEALAGLGLAEPGFGSTHDITACPGTDTCNLGIANTTAISLELEKVMTAEYPDLIHNNNIKIKISGCPNSCGQHGLASIGFHGSSFKVGDHALPALQLVLGGARLGNGEGILAEKVIKLPSKRGPDALRQLLDDYHEYRLEGEYYENYYARRGRQYFRDLLQPLADLTDLAAGDFVDWGHSDAYVPLMKVGESARVVVDLVGTLLIETEEKKRWADRALHEKHYADAIYHGYNVFVNGAKALLLKKDVIVNTQHGVLRDFELHYGSEPAFNFPDGFKEHVLRMGRHEPSEAFAVLYVEEAGRFLDAVSQSQAGAGEERSSS